MTVSKEMFFVYVLKNNKDQIYIGQTNDLNNRLIRHNLNKEKYTRNKGPFEIIYKEEYDTRTEAMKRKKELKSSRGRNWIRENLI